MEKLKDILGDIGFIAYFVLVWVWVIAQMVIGG